VTRRLQNIRQSVVVARSALLVAGCAIAAAIGAAACGPSFQAVYESDLHFEHCYALDQTTATPEAKEECWREWLHGYTYGQSRDRVEYAATRFSELSLDPTLPQEEARSARVRPSSRSVAAPVPTNAFAPPPNMIDHRPPPVTSVASDPPPDPPAAIRAPGADCADTCAHQWSSCHEGCRDSACDGCDRSYRACVRPCFRDEPGAHPGARSAH
jgi:hypothetical protein